MNAHQRRVKRRKTARRALGRALLRAQFGEPLTVEMLAQIGPDLGERLRNSATRGLEFDPTRDWYKVLDENNALLRAARAGLHIF